MFAKIPQLALARMGGTLNHPKGNRLHKMQLKESNPVSLDTVCCYIQGLFVNQTPSQAHLLKGNVMENELEQPSLYKSPTKDRLILSLSGSKTVSVSAPERVLVQAVPEGIPKKPNTPWVQFVAEKMPLIKQQFPDIHPRQRMQKISRKWRELPVELKLKMEAEYKEARMAWLRNMEMVSKDLMEISREEKRLKKKVKLLRAGNLELKRLLRKLEKPSKPPNSFILYCQEQGWEGRRMFDGMASDWRQMGEEEKEKFVGKSLLLKKEYKLEMKEWRDKMLKEGCLEDLVDLQGKVGQLRQEVAALENYIVELKRVQTLKEKS